MRHDTPRTLLALLALVFSFSGCYSPDEMGQVHRQGLCQGKGPHWVYATAISPADLNHTDHVLRTYQCFHVDSIVVIPPDK